MSDWLDDKITITLTRKDVFDLAGAIAEATKNDVEFTKIKDRKIRKMFAEAIKKRHELWLKITRVAEETKK